jgi:type I restriction enzyme, S subunit
MVNFQKCTLGDLIHVKHGFAFHGEYFSERGSHILLTPGSFYDVGGFRDKGDKEKWYSGPVPAEYVLKAGELIIAMTEQAEGLLGSSAIIPRSGLYLHNQRLGLVQVKDENATDRLFLYYLFNSQPVRQQIRASASGTKVRHTSPSRIAEVVVGLPVADLQRKIAGILAGYDELIENNQRRLRILEEMARSLYREWFVHFRFPGHENHSRVPSPLGEIPKGWDVCPIESLVAFQIGGGWGKDVVGDQCTEAAWVIRGTDIPNAKNSDTAFIPYRYHAPSNLRSRKLEAGDIVFEVSGGSKGQPVGRSLLVTNELLSAFHDEDVMCASFCKRIQPDATKYRSELLYLSFLEGYESGEIEQYQVQSTGISNFKWTAYIANTHRIVPPESVQEKFQTMVKPLLKQVATLGLQSVNLRRSRDLLLPRLLSGQIKLEAN